MSLIARNPGSRVAAGICVSLLVNAIVWCAASGVFRRRLAVTSPRLTFERVVIDRKTGVKHIKAPAKPKPVKKPLPKHLPKPRAVVRTDQKPPPPPPPADHHAIIAAKPSSTGPKPDFQAPERGTAKPGAPVAEQGPGVITPPKTPPRVVAPPEAPPPVVEPVKTSPPVVEPPKPAPPVVEPPKPPPPPPPKVDPPKPKGPTRDAEPASTVNPEIPDNLKSDDLKTFVRVKVHIQPDGSFEVILRTSSHNPEVDRIVLDALKRWKWKPALEAGAPVESTKLFKFEFEVK